MPNLKEHMSTAFIVTGIIGAISNIISQNEEIRNGERQFINVGDVIGNGIVSGSLGTVGSLIPDFLEPATHPNHRSTFHSITSLLTSIKLTLSDNLSDNHLIKYILIGNSIHLLQDSTTTKGIPLF